MQKKKKIPTKRGCIRCEFFLYPQVLIWCKSNVHVQKGNNRKKKGVQTIGMLDLIFNIYYQNGIVRYQRLINLLREALNNMIEDSLPTFMLNLNFCQKLNAFKNMLNCLV